MFHLGLQRHIIRPKKIPQNLQDLHKTAYLYSSCDAVSEGGINANLSTHM